MDENKGQSFAWAVASRSEVIARMAALEAELELARVLLASREQTDTTREFDCRVRKLLEAWPQDRPPDEVFQKAVRSLIAAN